jgi:hypothetical protein
MSIYMPPMKKNVRGLKFLLELIWRQIYENWMTDKLRGLQDEARHHGKPLPVRLPANMPVFTVPAGLVRILDRDLQLAGIPKCDERGRTVDVHALRYSFGTHLSKAGVAPRVAQAAMRHSTIELTMNVYTDPKLLDVAGAINKLPELPLGGEGKNEIQRATGTDAVTELPNPQLAPMLAPKSDKTCINRTMAGQLSHESRTKVSQQGIVISALTDTRKNVQTCSDNRVQKIGVAGQF